MVKERLENVLMALVDPPAVPLRESIDPDKIRELAESIREQGLQEPVIVRPQNGRYEIVFGHRRYLAHRFLGLTDIKAIVRKMSDVEMTVLRAIENIQRENLTLIEEAKAYRLMMEQGGLTRAEIAKKVGKSIFTIDKFSRLLKLPVCVQEALHRKEICMDVGFALGEIDDESMLVYYLKMAVDNGVTTPVVRMWVDDYFKSKQGTLYDDAGSIPQSDVDIVAKPVFMTCEGCLGPVALKDSRSVVMCVECIKKVRGKFCAKS